MYLVDYGPRERIIDDIMTGIPELRLLINLCKVADIPLLGMLTEISI